MSAPFRADHVGSLLRPHELHDLREQVRLGKASAAELKAGRGPPDPRGGRSCRRTSACRRSPTASSAATGGTSTSSPASTASSCATRATPTTASSSRAPRRKPPTMFVTGKLRRTKPSMVPHFEFLKKTVTPGHAEVHHALARDAARARRPRLDPKTYPDAGRVLGRPRRSATARRSPISTRPAAATCRSTTPRSPCSATRRCRSSFRKLGDDPKKDVAIYAEAVNAAIRDVPDDMTVAIHTCRGNFKSTWLASGSYDYVAETAFSKLDVDGFFLEYDDERSGGFEPLRYIAEGQEGGARPGQLQGPRSSRRRML